MTTNQLTANTVKNAKPKEVDGVLKDNRYADGGGLYLLVTAKGGKLWRYNFSLNGKKLVLPFGKYPQLSLKDVRELHKEAINQIAKGINPVEEKRKKKQTEKNKERSTFKDVSQDWLEKQKGVLAVSTLSRHERVLIKDFYPTIGNKIMAEIEKGELVKVAKRIQDRGSLEMGHRGINLCN